MTGKSENKDLQKCLEYIENYWEKITLRPQKFKIGNRILKRVVMQAADRENFHTIEVPFTCLVPNDSKYRYVFYWDSYFMFRGLLGTDREWIIPEMVENFVYLFKKHHIIPNFSHPESLGRSQAPFLTSMIFDAYRVIGKDKSFSGRLKRIINDHNYWLKNRIAIAKEEYQEVWESPTDVDHQHYNHKVIKYGLNRYGDRDVGYGHNAEQESGWDMTSRFYSRCDNFLPIDLNCFLYKYEIDFARSAKIFNDSKEEEYWQEKAQTRKDLINKYMWNEQEGFFFDYDYVHKTQSTFLSLAGFVPLWAGIAESKQAKKLIKKIPLFRTKFGLAITAKSSLAAKTDLSAVSKPYRITIAEALKPKQWDYPNIWPPLHYLVTIGLIRYGYLEIAKALMEEYRTTNMQAFKKYGSLLEKIDGKTGDKPQAYWYPTQLGFGWTNGIFYRYSQIIKALDENKSIYLNPNSQTPPYDLAILN